MAEYNCHHSFWNRSWYRSPIQRALRQHEGLVVPMYEQVHRDLHADMPPPPRPNSAQILGALGMLDRLSSQTLSRPPETVLALSEHFLLQDDSTAQRIGHHLLRQSAWIAEGYYHEV